MVTSLALEPEFVCRALEASGQAMFEVDLASKKFSWSDPAAARALLGADEAFDIQDADAVLGMLEDEYLIQRHAAIDEARTSESHSYALEFRINAERGEHWIEERGMWLRFGDQEKLIGVMRVIDEQKNREQELNHLASHDELTGQKNRSRTMVLLRETLDAVHAGTRTASLLLIGIDAVGQINNDFGFDIADQVITDVAARIDSVIDDNGIVGRVAGTKFTVILNSNNQELILRLARGIMNSMRERLSDTNAGGVGISVCIGATKLSPHTSTASAAIAETEAAFDQARRKGASSFSMFSEKTETVSQRRKNSQMTDIILTALNDRRIYLAYQPIVEDINLEITKYECLIRMKGDHGEEIPAPSFIPAAERLGLVHLLDRRVLELATQAMHKVDSIILNVNLSWETVKDAVWAEGYLTHLRANRKVCDRLTIELTETQVVDAMEESIEFMAAAKSLGCKFAIDDFGAGYTSFRNLKALDIDVLKIDGSFISGVSSSRENQLFVRTLLDLARNFGMKTVAEWVDNEADATLLKALGVDYLQGYLLGKPEPHPEWGSGAPSAVEPKTICNLSA